MAKLLSGEYSSKKKINYIVNIYDNQLETDSTDEMTISNPAKWTYAGKTKDIYQTLQPLAVTIEINVPGATGPVADFVDKIIEEVDSHRYHIEITRGGSLFFRGWLQINQSSKPIRSQTHFPFTIRASCSLGQMDKYDLIDPATPETPYRGRVNIVTFILQCLKSADIFELYGDNDPILATSTDYHNTEMPNTTDDFLSRMYLDHRLFAAETEEQFRVIRIILSTITIPLGEQPTEPGVAKDALEALCFSLNASLFHANGKYYFVSRGRMLSGPPMQIWNYKKDGTLISSTTEAPSITIGSLSVNNTGYYNYNGVYTYLTPLKELIIDHQKGGGNNKITGAEWAVGSHSEVCFDEINNQGNATILGRFVLKTKIKHINNTDTGWFRMVIGIKIKIGQYYLIRDVSDGFDIYGNSNSDLGLVIPYDDPEWSTTEGYYNVVITKRARASIFTDLDDDVTIVDIESPVIPESGELCVDIDFVSIRKHDSFLTPFDDRWDSVVFQSESVFERSGKTWQLYWEAKDNYVNIQSDDAELNEDTLAYARYTAEVNSRNSSTLDYSTPIGDDPGSNTHGRWQIDRSVENDGSDIVDADGGWSFRGAGTVFDKFNKLLAWDMARLRVGVVRIMSGENKGSIQTYLPNVPVDFDSKIQIMAAGATSSAGENTNGVWLSIADKDNSKVTIKAKLFGKASATSPSTTNIYTSGDTAGDKVNTRKYIHRADGVTTSRITFPTSKPLPDVSVYDPDYINSLFSKEFRDNSPMIYKSTPNNDSSFGIDNSTNEIILYRTPRSSTVSYYFVWGG